MTLFTFLSGKGINSSQREEIPVSDTRQPGYAVQTARSMIEPRSSNVFAASSSRPTPQSQNQLSAQYSQISEVISPKAVE
jgi:hypothetical protein